MKIPKHLEADILARADTVGPSVAIPQTTATFCDIVVGKTITGIWTFRIPNWMPSPVNKLYDHHWSSRRKHKKDDAEIVAYYGRYVPKAAGKRAVTMHVVFPPKRRMPDVDALWKSTLDSLVGCGILVNDSASWVRMNPVAYSRGDTLMTFITVEDLYGEDAK